ncbi:hypothetical protein [Halomonas casei]|uniref:hypothetical protein n=1 Tax=Halomonas casei TaxID=2742613 RepID=UPI003CF63CF5
MKVFLPLLSLMALLLAGCGTTHQAAPEPNMSHLVSVNQSVPAELYDLYSDDPEQEVE